MVRSVLFLRALEELLVEPPRPHVDEPVETFP
jgi:hypothetical protein